jgi:hypothetical protein
VDELDSTDQLLYPGVDYNFVQVVFLQNGQELRPQLKIDDVVFELFGYQKFWRNPAYPFKRLELIPNGGRIVVLVGNQYEDVDTVIPVTGDLSTVIARGTTAPRNLSDRFGELPSVLDWGAFGDGVTDDRAAFAVASAAAIGKRVPSGTYRIASNITLTGTWFDPGATLKPDAGVVVTFNQAALIYAAAPWVDAGAGGSATYQAGASKISVQPGATSKTDNIVNGYGGNAVAGDVSISVIAGGGNVGSEQLIGYTELHDVIVGDGATTTWLTSFDATPANILIRLVRADLVNVTLAAGQFGAVQSGTKVQITYPLPGHFVNDATGGAEGTNPAVLATQELYVSSNVKPLNAGSGCDYSGILDGYDNVITNGIRQSASGAHHRIATTDGGNHDTIFGGSYNRISKGSYGGIFAGSSNEINAGGSGSFITGYGNTISGTGPGTALGSTNTVSGAFAAALGGTNLTVSGNGAAAVGRLSTVSGQDSFAAGSTQTVSAPFSSADGFTNSITGTGYSSASGRLNQLSGGYSSATGFANTSTADYTRVAGRDALAALPFADVVGGEKIVDAGDVQTSTIVARRQTANATPTELRLGAATARLSIANGRTWMFSIIVAARQIATAAASAGWKLEGVLRNDGGTVAIVGTVTKTIIGRDTALAACDVNATADNTNKALSLTATGVAGLTINWVARIELAEIGG